MVFLEIQGQSTIPSFHMRPPRLIRDMGSQSPRNPDGSLAIDHLPHGPKDTPFSVVEANWDGGFERVRREKPQIYSNQKAVQALDI